VHGGQVQISDEAACGGQPAGRAAGQVSAKATSQPESTCLEGSIWATAKVFVLNGDSSLPLADISTPGYSSGTGISRCLTDIKVPSCISLAVT
jgi:hypothetical protein